MIFDEDGIIVHYSVSWFCLRAALACTQMEVETVNHLRTLNCGETVFSATRQCVNCLSITAD